MHVLGVRSEEDGTQRLAKIPEPVQRGARSIGRSVAPQPTQELSLVGFQGEMTASCFFGTFAWAPFWRSHLQSAAYRDHHSISNANRACFQAIMYGYAGMRHGNPALTVEGHRLYGRTLRTSQSLLVMPRPAKPILASLAITTVLMGMYEVKATSCAKIRLVD
jgi:hypothetical protein